MRFLVVPSLLAALIVFAACSGGDTKTVTVERTVTETTTGTVPSEAPALVTLYFLRDGKVAPEQRGIVSRPDIATVTLHQLFEGPTTALQTAIPPDLRLRRLTVAGGVANLELGPNVPGAEAQAQIVYTLTQFPTVKRVAINGRPPLGRAAFEARTPAILVESPLPGETVEPGFEVRGTANTFEATFNYELKDQGGRVLRKSFVTATSGSGTRGTFRFTVPYEVDEPQQGALVVFEISAENGSRINESEIPLQLE
jgi:Immunoglobulin-like domain of bacterial spore germination/Sporulation and spore germination